MKWLLLTAMSPQPVPEITQEHQTLKLPGSGVAWRLPAQAVCSYRSIRSWDFQASPLLQEHQSVWPRSRLQHGTQTSWLGLGSQGVQASCQGVWQWPPCHFVVKMFSQNILVFQVILVLQSWEVFREICFSHLPVGKGKRMNCMYSFPSLGVSILNSTQRLNWILSFHLLSSSEEYF